MELADEIGGAAANQVAFDRGAHVPTPGARVLRLQPGAVAALPHGRLQRQAEVIHVLTTRLEDLSERMRGMGSQSRDFC